LSTKNKEFKNVPPLVPSEVSNTDRQRTEGTGGISVLTPVSLPFSSEMTPKREGNVRDIESHSRVSNALYIRV
jgi:hypothetical protein